jgi:hypothetical protein
MASETALDGGGEECGARNLEGGTCWKPPDHLADHAYLTEPRVADVSEPGIGGYFAEIAFFGRIEHTGYVTEVVLHGGQAAYHIDLPEKLWGGNPLAWREYAASAFFEKNPVTEESVRKAWEAERERAERWKQQQAEWERQRSQPALEAGDGDDGLGDDDDGELAF